MSNNTKLVAENNGSNAKNGFRTFHIRPRGGNFSDRIGKVVYKPDTDVGGYYISRYGRVIFTSFHVEIWVGKRLVYTNLEYRPTTTPAAVRDYYVKHTTRLANNNTQQEETHTMKTKNTHTKVELATKGTVLNDDCVNERIIVLRVYHNTGEHTVRFAQRTDVGNSQSLYGDWHYAVRDHGGRILREGFTANTSEEQAVLLVHEAVAAMQKVEKPKRANTKKARQHAWGLLQHLENLDQFEKGDPIWLEAAELLIALGEKYPLKGIRYCGE